MREPHPIKAWAPEPGIPGEQRVSRVLPGGHVTATRTALANWEADEAQVRRNNVIVNASEIAARQRAEEAARPSERPAPISEPSSPRRADWKPGRGRGRPIGAADRARPRPIGGRDIPRCARVGAKSRPARTRRR